MESDSEIRALELAIDKLKSLKKEIVKNEKSWQNHRTSKGNRKYPHEAKENHLDTIRKKTWDEIFGYEPHLKFGKQNEGCRVSVEYSDLEFERICYGQDIESNERYPDEIEDKIINVLSRNIKRGTALRIGEKLFVDDWIFCVHDITYYDEDFHIFYQIIEIETKQKMYREDLAQRFPEVREIYDLPRYDPNDYYKDND